MDDNLIIEDNVLKGCRQSKIITATIPEGIVAICDNAFSDFPNLMNITLPKSLSKIDRKRCLSELPEANGD